MTLSGYVYVYTYVPLPSVRNLRQNLFIFRILEFIQRKSLPSELRSFTGAEI
jgi:hypothetical protein